MRVTLGCKWFCLWVCLSVFIGGNSGFADPGSPATKTEQEKKAHELFEKSLPLAEKGDVTAQYRVGVIYFDGMGGIARRPEGGFWSGCSVRPKEVMQRPGTNWDAFMKQAMGCLLITSGPMNCMKPQPRKGHGEAALALGNDVSHRYGCS